MSSKHDSSTMFRIYEGLVARASNIPNFMVGQIRDVPYDITELATNCAFATNNKDDFTSDVYFSALMVRYWHMIAKIYDKVKGYGVDVESVVTILYQSIAKAIKYQSWLNTEKYISKSSQGAEKVINQCITSTVANYIKALNVNKVKMLNDSVSLDDTENQIQIYENDDYKAVSGCGMLISKLIEKKKYLDALVIDMISFKDYSTKKSLQEGVLGINKRYLANFVAEYDVQNEVGFITDMNKFIDMPDSSKIKELTKCLKGLKNNESFIRSYVC